MVLRPVSVRFGLVLGLLTTLVAPVAFASTPAAAAQVTTTRTAIASWVSTGAGSPNVSLQVTETTGPLHSYTFFNVNENYCDTATKTTVFLSYGASGPQSNQLFAVTPKLKAAVLAAPLLSVDFTEQTAPECNANGSDLTTVVSGPRNVSLFGLWRATGPVTTTFPGEQVRPADAVVWASAPAPLSLAHLGNPTFAQISRHTASN